MREFEVIIIGAGAAGIAAASRLLENNVSDFIILEASDRIGGRIYSVPFGQGVVDLGAEWVHGIKGNVVSDLANSLDLLFETNVFCAFSQFTRSDGIRLDKEAVQILFAIADDIYDHSEHELKSEEASFRNYFETKYWKRVDPLVDGGTIKKIDAELFLTFAEQFFSSIIGSPSWGEVSLSESTTYHTCEGCQVQCWKQGGYATILDILMKKRPFSGKQLEVEEKVFLNSEVNMINYATTSVLISCTDGSQYKSQKVICTLPLGVLKAKATDLFVPSLSHNHLNAIKGIAIDAVDKIFLEFPYHWWPTGSSGITCVWTPEDLKLISPELAWTTKVFGFYRNDSQPITVLCGWVVGEAARTMEGLPDEEVKRQCMLLLRRFTGESVEVPEPISFMRSSWYSNPYVKGAYSYRSLETDEMKVQHIDLAAPICNSSGEPVSNIPKLFYLPGKPQTRNISPPYMERLKVAGEKLTGFYETGPPDSITVADLHAAVTTFSFYLTDRNEKRCTVAIIGGGIAGLGAARTLIAAGVDTVILEAQSYPGGRILSKLTESGWVELGAQWIHGEETTICQIAAANNLLSSEVSTEGLGRYCRLDGTAISIEVVKEVGDILEEILDSCERFQNLKIYPKSVEEELDAKFAGYLQRFPSDSEDYTMRLELFEWHKRFQLIDNSCSSLKDLSAKAWGLYENCGGKHCINFKECYGQLVDAIVRDLPPVVLQLNQVVQCIEWSPCLEGTSGPFVQITGKDFVVHANHIIVTCSLGYLKKNEEQLFKPPLPSPLKQAIQHLGFSTIAKLFVLYSEPWWSENQEGFQLVWTRNSEIEEKVPWSLGVQGFDVMPGRPTLLCWVGGNEAVILEKTPEDEIADHVTLLLRHFTGNHNIPKPFRIYRSQWHENEFVLGAYSHVTAACDDGNINCGTLQEPVYSEVKNGKEKVPTVLLAGEACSLHHYSTVHGAYESGQHQAEVILNYRTASN